MKIAFHLIQKERHNFWKTFADPTICIFSKSSPSKEIEVSRNSNGFSGFSETYQVPSQNAVENAEAITRTNCTKYSTPPVTKVFLIVIRLTSAQKLLSLNPVTMPALRGILSLAVKTRQTSKPDFRPRGIFRLRIKYFCVFGNLWRTTVFV